MSQSTQTNGVDQEKVKSFVSRIDNLNDEIASEQGSYMKRCRELKDDIKDILEEAKSAGIPPKVLKAVLKARDLERKAEQARDDLDNEDQDIFDNIADALGVFADTPLGAAAVAKAGDKAKPKGLPGATH